MKDCEKSHIFSKPCMKIEQKNNEKQKPEEMQKHKEIKSTFVITMSQNTLHNYCLRQCCLPHCTLEYEIYEKVEQNFKQIGLIKNEFQGCYKEYCTRGDEFKIELNQQLNKEAKVLLIFGCLQLNYQEYETMINLP